MADSAKYFRAYDVACKRLAVFIGSSSYEDKRFRNFVQDKREERLSFGQDKYGDYIRFRRSRKSHMAVTMCLKQIYDYSKTNDVVCLYDALNYLMIEYFSEYQHYVELAEVDVLACLFESISDFCDIFEAFSEIIDNYTVYFEQGYILLAGVYIMDELYRRMLDGDVYSD